MMKRHAVSYKHLDVREVPSYGITEAAHYLRTPRTTIRDWVTGRHYHGMAGQRFSKPIIVLADPQAKLLSFMNLVRDVSGIPVKLYPFTRKRSSHDGKEEPKAIVIDPHVSFGRLVLAGTGIPTAVVAERYKAGESVDDLADDYGRKRLEIEEAIRCELALEAA